MSIDFEFSCNTLLLTYLLVVTLKKRVYLKTLSKQVGERSSPFKKNYNELIFDIK